MALCIPQLAGVKQVVVNRLVVADYIDAVLLPTLPIVELLPHRALRYSSIHSLDPIVLPLQSTGRGRGEKRQSSDAAQIKGTRLR